MELLNRHGDKYKQEYESVISWTPDGNAFIIHQPKQFQESVLPEYFLSDANFNSFCRKVLYVYHDAFDFPPSTHYLALY